MDKPEAFIQTAVRALDVALALEASGYAEAAVFYACHAFEQAGTALILSAGKSYPGTHVNRATEYRKTAHDKNVGHNVNWLTFEIPGLRARALYPDPEEHYLPPADRIKPADARELISDVGGEVRAVRRYI